MRCLVSLCIIASVTVLVGAQSSDQLQPIAPVTPSCPTGQAGSILINGNGQQQAVSDQAEVIIRVSVRNVTANGARELAAQFANRTIDSVRLVQGIYRNNVTTTTVTITPVTTRPGTDGVSQTVAYTAASSISVKISNVTGDQIAQVVGLGISEGGNNASISGVYFTLSDALSYQLTVAARRQAARDAQASAQTYAETLGVTLGAVLSVTDKTYSATPVQSTGLARSIVTDATASPSTGAQTTSTPIEIGTKEVSASITMVYTLCNRPS